MKRVFVSHASQDIGIAQRLCDDLRNAGHDVIADLYELRLGVDAITFMNKGLEQADFVVLLHSANTANAKWQKAEMNAATWNDISNERGQLIVLSVDDTLVPPLLRSKIYGKLTNDTYHTTFNELCTALLSEPSPTTGLASVLREESSNPFWRVRAEYFEELPPLLAAAFSPPDAAKLGLLEEMMPCFVEGSRGTGKTMLLMSLRARILASRPQPTKSIHEMFGFYVRLDRGAFCNSGIKAATKSPPHDLSPHIAAQLTDSFSQELHIVLLESLCSEVQYCARSGSLPISQLTESHLASVIGSILFGKVEQPPRTLDELLGLFADLHRQIAEFIRRKFIYEEQVSVPVATLDLTTLRRVIAEIRRLVPDLSKTVFCILLDEYENLFPFQKAVVNGLIRFGPPNFSVKVARKIGTEETSLTTVGQELQEIHDYNRISLMYSVEDKDDFRRYLDLLQSIVSRLLAQTGVDFCGLTHLLPNDESDEVDADALAQQVLLLKRKASADFAALPPTKQCEINTYYREAAIYRLLYAKRGIRFKKRFCGHREIAFLSSGVIRYFQEIMGMAFHLQTASGPLANPLRIDPQHQTAAVYMVSDHNLAALSRNVEAHGERLKYFLIDLADCLRSKLMQHGSEPEAGRIAISDPQNLRIGESADLSDLLNVGVREGVFQTSGGGRPGTRPKHLGDPQPVEFTITRVFAPALHISPRYRWRTTIRCQELLALCQPDTRRAGKEKLIMRLVKPPRKKAYTPLLGNMEDEDTV